VTRLGGRSPGTIVGAALQPRHYRAVANIARVCHRPGAVLYRYLTGRGRYPWDLALRTPLGTVVPRLYSHHDLLTVNEVFCRLDYFLDERPRVVVDIGSNIGLSALYFLTRNAGTRCCLYEPVPENLRRLERTLDSYRDRYTVEAAAVADVEGEVEFGVEPTGRYGGIGVSTGASLRVRCRSINAVVEEVLERHGRIDLIKLDTEGAEERTIRAIAPEHLDRIGAFYLEAQPSGPLLPGLFRQEQYGEVVRLFRIGG
jgi:FkbM family methyltransferase